MSTSRLISPPSPPPSSPPTSLTAHNKPHAVPVLQEDGSNMFFWLDERIWASALMITMAGLYFGMTGYKWGWMRHPVDHQDDRFGHLNLSFTVTLSIFAVIIGIFGCTNVLRQYSVNSYQYPFKNNLSKQFISLLNQTQGVVYVAAIITGFAAWGFSYVSQYYLADRNAEGPWLIAKSIVFAPIIVLLLIAARRQCNSHNCAELSTQTTLYSNQTTTLTSTRTFFADPRFYWLLLSIAYPISPIVVTADWLKSPILAKNVAFFFFSILGLLCTIPIIYFTLSPSHRNREHITTHGNDMNTLPVHHSYLLPFNNNINFNLLQIGLIGVNTVSNLIACAILYDIGIIEDYSDGAGEAIWVLGTIPFLYPLGLLAAIFSISDQLNTILITKFIPQTSHNQQHSNDLESR